MFSEPDINGNLKWRKMDGRVTCWKWMSFRGWQLAALWAGGACQGVHMHQKVIWYISTVAITNYHGIMMRGDMKKKVASQIHVGLLMASLITNLAVAHLQVIYWI